MPDSYEGPYHLRLFEHSGAMWVSLHDTRFAANEKEFALPLATFLMLLGHVLTEWGLDHWMEVPHA